MTRATTSGTGTAGDVLLTVGEVAARLGATGETVRRWLRIGRLQGMRLGGTKLGWRVRTADLAAFEAARRSTTTHETSEAEATYVCDLCGAEFCGDALHGLCSQCERDAVAYTAAHPEWEAEYEAWATAPEDYDLDTTKTARVMQIAAGEWAIRDSVAGTLIGPFNSIELAEAEAEALLAHRATTVAGGQR